MKVNFYISEDVRQEVDNKVSIIGIYADDKIMIYRDDCDEIISIIQTRPLILENLTFMFNVSDFVGDINVDMQIISPSGFQLTDRFSAGENTLIEGRSHNLIVKAGPFPVIEVGTYKVLLFIHDETLEFPFDIIIEKPRTN